jgi:hypothetical protein
MKVCGKGPTPLLCSTAKERRRWPLYFGSLCGEAQQFSNAPIPIRLLRPSKLPILGLQPGNTETPFLWRLGWGPVAGVEVPIANIGAERFLIPVSVWKAERVVSKLEGGNRSHGRGVCLRRP